MADERKQELTRELADARVLAGLNRREFTEDVRGLAQIKQRLARYRGLWLTGAVLLGLVISKLPPRTKKVVVRRDGTKRERELKEAGKVGLGLAAVKMIFDITKPVITAWATRWVKRKMTDRYATR